MNFSLFYSDLFRSSKQSYFNASLVGSTVIMSLVEGIDRGAKISLAGGEF